MKINWDAIIAWTWVAGWWAVTILACFGVISYWWIVAEFSAGIILVWAAVIWEDWKLQKEAKHYRESIVMTEECIYDDYKDEFAKLVKDVKEQM